MDYDEWLKAGNGARDDESLEDSISRTVGNMYDFPSACPECGSGNFNAFNDHLWHCESCGHYWSMK